MGMVPRVHGDDNNKLGLNKTLERKRLRDTYVRARNCCVAFVSCSGSVLDPETMQLHSLYARHKCHVSFFFQCLCALLCLSPMSSRQLWSAMTPTVPQWRLRVSCCPGSAVVLLGATCCISHVRTLSNLKPGARALCTSFRRGRGACRLIALARPPT